MPFAQTDRVILRDLAQRVARIADKEDLPMTSPDWPNGPGGRAIKIKIPMFDATDAERMTEAEIAARRRMLEVLYYF